MDYSLAAVKMYIAHLKPAKPAKELTSNGGAAFAIGSLIFQRAWLQVFFDPSFTCEGNLVLLCKFRVRLAKVPSQSSKEVGLLFGRGPAAEMDSSFLCRFLRV